MILGAVVGLVAGSSEDGGLLEGDGLLGVGGGVWGGDGLDGGEWGGLDGDLGDLKWGSDGLDGNSLDSWGGFDGDGLDGDWSSNLGDVVGVGDVLGSLTFSLGDDGVEGFLVEETRR